MKMPSREWTGALTTIVVAVALAALDLLDGSVDRWWAEHAFTTTLVGGLLVLLVTVLIADRVTTARRLRDQSRAIAAQAAIVMTQAARTAQNTIAMLEGTADREAVADDLRSYGTMLLIAAPMLIDASLSRAFLEEAQRLAGELTRALHAQRRGTAGETERARVDAAVVRMRRASIPLLAILNPEQREAVADDPANAAANAAAPG
jgi:cytochrome bd-type quinol oxidase subunit 1